MTNNTDLTPGQWLHQKRGAIERMVPNAKTAERLVTIMTREVATNPDLARCARESLLDAAIESAKLGLEIGGSLGHCWIVPFKTKRGGMRAQLIVGYRGFVALMKRGNPTIRDVFPVIVRECDEWSINPANSSIDHSYDPFNPERAASAIVGAYCRVVYNDGHTWDLPMPIAAIEKRRAIAQTDNVWKTWYEEMCMKTVIRQAAKYVELSAEVMELFHRVDLQEVAVTQVDKHTQGVEETKAKLVESLAEPDEEPEVDPNTGEIIPPLD